MAIKNILIWSLSLFILSACGGGSGQGENEDSNSTKITLDSINLDGVPASLKVADSVQLVAMAQFSDNSHSDISTVANWSSSNDAIATVSDNGLVTAVSAGAVSISVNSENVTQSIQVTVIELSSLSVSPSIKTIAKNTQLQFFVTGINSDNSTEDVTQQVTWSVNDTSLASIDDKGLLLSLKSGNVIVVAKMAGKTTEAHIEITSAVINAISLQVPDVMANLSSHQLIAIGTYTDGSTQDITRQVSWQVSDNSIASITPTGFVSALAQGSATVMASLDNISGSAGFLVSEATLATIEVSPKILTLPAGNKEPVDLTALYSDLSVVNINSEAIWSSSNAAVATVESGNVVAHSTGSAVLTAAYLGMTTTLQITVSDAELNGISVLPVNQVIPVGLTQQFIATGHYSDGSAADITEQVTWLSSDTSIVTIENGFANNGLAQAVAQGTVSITATKNNISKSIQLSVSNAVIQSIEIQPINQSVAKGSNVVIKAVGHFSDGSSLDVTDIVQWSATDSSVLDVTQAGDGLIKAVEQGNSLINASLHAVTGLGQITVSSAILNSISITSELSDLPKGVQLKLLATGEYSDATTQDLTAQVTWQSSDSGILGFSYNAGEEGTVLANNVGTVTITASLLNADDVVINASSDFSVTNAVLESLLVSAPETSLNINSGLVINARAFFSDGSEKDVSQEVNWQLSDDALASVESGGVLRALLSGNIELSATLDGIQSNALAIQIIQDDNAASDIELTIQSNVILNNDSDDALLKATLVPADSSGTIADGTAVTFTVFEGDTEVIKSASTVDGVATVTYTSLYNGLVLVVARIDGTDIQTTGALLATDSFDKAIIKLADVSGSYDEDEMALEEGSGLSLYLRNISNRNFIINSINISYGTMTSQTHFPESPTSSPEFTSNNDLTAGEYTGIGYLLDEDTKGTIFMIVYNLTEPETSISFDVGVVYNFTP